MAAVRDHRPFPWRLNGRRSEAFVRGGPRRGTIALHRKLDGGLLAEGRWTVRGAVVVLRLHAAGRAIAGVRAAVAELAPLLARSFPRRLLRLEIGSGRRWEAVRIGPRCGAPRAGGGAVPAALRAAIATVLREVPADYAASRGLPRVAEARRLARAGFDLSGRECWLRPDAARRWRALAAAAGRDGIAIALVSGFRSATYQARIIERKRARGESMTRILAVNAAPGHSEHHAGTAVDVGVPGLPPVDGSFEATPAHAWLQQQAARRNLRLSYPRDNPHGILHEPWHWRFMD